MQSNAIPPRVAYISLITHWLLFNTHRNWYLTH